MRLKKKIYHYDSDQYVDANGNLFFKTLELQTISGKKLYIVENVVGEQTIIDDETVLKPVSITIKDIVHSVCKLYDYGHNNPKGFIDNRLRTLVIRMCFMYAYKEVNKDNKPTHENISVTFGIEQKTVASQDAKVDLWLKESEKTRDQHNELVKYITSSFGI